MESQIQTLQEMGFSQDQAVEALKYTHGDLTKAIAYLFGEVDDPKPATGAGTEASPYVVEASPVRDYDLVNVSNPQDLPDFLGQYASNEAMETPRVEHYPTYDEYPSQQGLDQYLRQYPGQYPGQYSAPRSSLNDLDSNMDMDVAASPEADFGPNHKTEGHLFPVIVSGKARHQYWVPLVAILAQFAPFADAVLTEEHPSPFLEQVQRLVYFVRHFSASSRYYVRADELVETLPPLQLGDDYLDEEVILNAYEHLMAEHQPLREVLESLVESVEENISKELTVLEMDADTRRTNLYRTLNELFWQKGFAKLGLIKYKRVAPLVTYQLVGDSSGYMAPFELQETVYPEVYSERAQTAVKREVEQMQRAENELQAVTRRVMGLNFFEGKKIASLLRQASDGLAAVGAKFGANGGNGAEPGAETGPKTETGTKTETEIGAKTETGTKTGTEIGAETQTETGGQGAGAAKTGATAGAKTGPGAESAHSPAAAGADLARLAARLEAARAHEAAAQHQLRGQAAGDQLASYDRVVAECNLQPYDLVGVICSQSHYYVRTAANTYVLMDERVFVDFESVRMDVGTITRRGSHLVTLIYGARDGCPGESDLEDDSSDDGKNEGTDNHENYPNKDTTVKHGNDENDNDIDNDNENDNAAAVDGTAVLPESNLIDLTDEGSADRDLAIGSGASRPSSSDSLAPGPNNSHQGGGSRPPETAQTSAPLPTQPTPAATATQAQSAPPLSGSSQCSVSAAPGVAHLALADAESAQDVPPKKGGARNPSAADRLDKPRGPARVAQRVVDQFNSDERDVPVHLM